VSLDDWLLALHLLAAFVFVGAGLGFWAMIVAAWRVDSPSGVAAVLRLSPVLNGLAGLGALVSLALGIWLAISLDAYEPWDGWVIAAIVLWLVAVGAGDRGNAEYARAAARARELASAGGEEPSPELRALVRSRRGLVLVAIATAALILILADMIWKPGA
jgi:uncharacterized membrane protein